jgi:hypothetical protein
MQFYMTLSQWFVGFVPNALRLSCSNSSANRSSLSNEMLSQMNRSPSLMTCWRSVSLSTFTPGHVMTKAAGRMQRLQLWSVTAILACPLVRSRKSRMRHTRVHLGTVSSRGTCATGTGESRRTIPSRSLAARVSASLAWTIFFHATLTSDCFYYSATGGGECSPPNGAHNSSASGQDRCLQFILIDGSSNSQCQSCYIRISRSQRRSSSDWKMRLCTGQKVVHMEPPLPDETHPHVLRPHLYVRSCIPDQHGPLVEPSELTEPAKHVRRAGAALPSGKLRLGHLDRG